MADEVTKTEKVIILGDGEFPLIDHGVKPVFVEVLTESRHYNGVVYLSAGSIFTDGANKAEVHVTTRLRMSLVSAQIMRDVLTEVIDGALKPVEKDKAH